ncbi:MAG: hypothetical protein AVDCRST_MAG88-4602 [uncultured Thermomicrobiales bacterium]|uniref:DUF2382 domain-containing protein n=1 Tax=uncultured Thermomicrobiales bacterium TaxID=1645740 RepID=A0A6J4VUM2_9BACT|nr:MAG: hypothetical protein AVDCRST_MAG88-4602 [uncultured Thermomicrobiales bacterium]
MAGMEIERDARVMASDGEVGRVSHVVVDKQTREVTEIVVNQQGREVLIPISAVASADGKMVRLRGTRAQVQSAGTFSNEAFHAVDDDRAEAESQGATRHGGAPLQEAREDAVTISGVQAATPAPRRQAQPVRQQQARPAEGEIHVPVAEERLSVAKQGVELGEVELRKTVTQEQVSVPVELMREEITVQQRDIADRPAQAGDQIFQEGTISVPVRGEEAVVTKEAVVTGEVVIDKERLVEQQTVTDTVRKERVEVDEQTYQTGRGAAPAQRGPKRTGRRSN